MLVYTEANNSTRDTVVTKKREKEVRDDDENKDGMNEAEDEIFSLLNLDPRKSDSKEKFKFRERAVLVMARLNSSAFQRKYKMKGYWIDPEKTVFPLTAVCALGASLSAIKKVYDVYPAAAFDALRQCSAHKFPLPVVKFIVESQPQVLDQVDNSGRTVLHYSAICNSLSTDVINYLVSQNEFRLLTKTTKGSTPLHLACATKLPLEKLMVFADREKSVFKVSNIEGKTPLFLACCEKTPLDVIKYLLDSCPTSLGMADLDGYTPLHAACCSTNMSLELVEFLVMWDKMTLIVKTTKGGSGRSPLHVASALTGRMELVSFLATTNPSILTEPDNEGLTPLHVACACSDLETVKALLSMNEEVLKLKTHQYYTPFVEACVAENMPVVVHMAETYPDVLSIKSNLISWYPLHHACAEGKKDALKFLLEKYPAAAKEVDTRGRTPLALVACREDCDPNIIYLLVSSYFDAVKILDNDGIPPLNHDHKDALIALFLENRSV